MPRKTLTITDVTVMRNRRICIAGYDRDQNCLRPVLPHPGVLIDYFLSNGETTIYPTAKVQFEFIRSIESPPHIEDNSFDSNSINFRRIATDENWERLLSQTDARTYSNLFPSMTDRYVLPGSDGPSLGTIKAKLFSFYINETEPLKLRAMVTDQDDETIYNMPIKDIAFTQFVSLKIRRHGDYNTAKRRILDLMRGREIYIRFSLARPWKPDHLEGKVCYLQVSGIYTIPALYNGNYKRLIQNWYNSLE